MPKQLVYITAFMLIVAWLPMPYGYYTLLRLVATIAFAWAAYAFHQAGNKGYFWASAILTLLFNPIFQVHFEKSLWVIIDSASAAFLVLASLKIAKDDL